MRAVSPFTAPAGEDRFHPPPWLAMGSNPASIRMPGAVPSRSTRARQSAILVLVTWDYAQTCSFGFLQSGACGCHAMWPLPRTGMRQNLPIRKPNSRCQPRREDVTTSLQSPDRNVRTRASSMVAWVRPVGMGSGQRAVESNVAACVPQRSRIARELCDEVCGCRRLGQTSGFQAPSSLFDTTPSTES